MVVGEAKRANIMDGIENTGDVRMHDHRLRLKQRFDIVRKLGQGTYGKVQLGINKKTGQEVAIKTIKKCKIESDADLVRIRREVQIMSSVRHPNIVHIYEVFENSEKMILVMEYCSGGELYDYLSQKKVLQEEEARRIFRQIATAVYYCHIHKICHRDLKLENVLLDETGSAKIADFGLSNVFKETSLLSTFCGSPLYASPEIVKGTPYIGPEVDCWSLGVLLYTLVYGAMPFDGSNFKRLVRQISNGDYYEPKVPSSASPLIRDILTVDPHKRADIVYICDHPWVNVGCSRGCLEMSEALAAQTPVRLDLLLSLAPAAQNAAAVMVPAHQNEVNTEESCTDLSNSITAMPVEPSNSAEKRILDLVAEGGEDAIKPSPTRTIVSATDNKRKLELAMSASGLQRKKEKPGSAATADSSPPPLPSTSPPDLTPTADQQEPEFQQSLKSSATMTISPAPSAEIKQIKDESKDTSQVPKEEIKEKTTTKPKVVKKKISPTKSVEEKVSPDKDEAKNDSKSAAVSSAAEKLTSLSIQPPAANQAPKPKKLSIPGGNVGSFKEQFERRASLTNTTPEVKRPVTKPVVSKIAKPKAQSEDRELPNKEIGSVRLQQIGIEPSMPNAETHHAGGVKKTESEPTHSTTTVDPSVLLQDARRSLQNSMAKLVEGQGQSVEERRRARDIISSAIRGGKPPVPYGRSNSAGITPALHSTGNKPVFRTEALVRVDDHRNRGASVERIIPIRMSDPDPEVPQPLPAVSQPLPAVTQPLPAGIPGVPTPTVSSPPTTASSSRTQMPVRRLQSNESVTSETSSSGEPIKKSAREFIIPIAVEGKGFVTPRQGSVDTDIPSTRHSRLAKPRRISLVSGGESEEEDDAHSMHRLRSSRAARAESVSSGEEDEEDEGFHLLTAENLFSTLLHRVRALTNRLNGEEGPGFSQNPHSLFNNLQSPFFKSPRLSRRHNALREGWSSNFNKDFDSMFNKSRQPFPRGISKKPGKHQPKSPDSPSRETGLDLSDLDLSDMSFGPRELEVLEGLTPGLSRRVQRHLLRHLPPAAATQLRRTLSLNAQHRVTPGCRRSHSAAGNATTSAEQQGPVETSTVPTSPEDQPDSKPPADTKATPPPSETIENAETPAIKEENFDIPAPQFSTLPRLKRRPISREMTPSHVTAADISYEPKITVNKDLNNSRASSIRSTPDRSLLSKYLTPERTLSLDDSYSSDSGSISTSLLSEPSYIAAYGTPSLNAGTSGLGLRRHSMRLTGDQPRKRISRFLRPDFFDTPPEESVFAKHKKEKEMETQKILKEIREKKNKTQEATAKSPTDTTDFTTYRDEPRKCLSPLGLLTNKDRSRSTTPFFPILDNIKEASLDSSLKSKAGGTSSRSIEYKSTYDNDNINKESRLLRPKSYPIKNIDSNDQTPKEVPQIVDKEDSENKSKESKLLRPRSYPTNSPSPEKVVVTRKKDTTKVINEKQSSDTSNDVEVSITLSLPRKSQPNVSSIYPLKENERLQDNENLNKASTNDTLLLKKYKVVDEKEESKESLNHKSQNGIGFVQNGQVTECIGSDKNEDTKFKVINHDLKNENVTLKPVETEIIEKKGTIKKKVVKKVSTKTKVDGDANKETNEGKPVTTKKKIVKKVKDKSTDETAKPAVKKKSMLQSLGHKLEKFASTKSSSPDKEKVENKVTTSDQVSQVERVQREQSVPICFDPPDESHLVKRAVTLTDVAALETPNNAQTKTTVSKVLGLFKKFDSKDKSYRGSVDKAVDVVGTNLENNGISLASLENDKAKRPTSLLLNGLGRKPKYNKAASDSVSVVSSQDDEKSDKITTGSRRNSLRLDLSRLPRVKKVAPTNPTIEPQIVYTQDADIQNDKPDKNGLNPASLDNLIIRIQERSRSRSRSNFSNSEPKSDHDTASPKANIFDPVSLESYHPPHREHEPTSPEKEDLAERIRRKSFYSRFNEKKQRRKSSLVGPGASEYDPVARIHSQPKASEVKMDTSPTSPATFDLSPGFTSSADPSPSSERYRSLMTELPTSPRSSLRYDNNYGMNNYRSLDRSALRKYPGMRSYLEYDPSNYGAHRYARTVSLVEDPQDTEMSSLRDAHKYNRTVSMYSPGNYATFRPKTTRNPAIILKDSEKEPSPENILEKIKQRKNFSISVTSKGDNDKDIKTRPDNSSKGEGHSPECSEKVDGEELLK